MFTYLIKKDGFILGSAKGKKNAVDRLKKELNFHGWAHLDNKWLTRAGIIICLVNNDINTSYTIERE